MRELPYKLAAKFFGQDEEGAVTVDWVVLAAATIGFALAVGSVLGPQFEAAIGGFNNEFQEATQ